MIHEVLVPDNLCTAVRHYVHMLEAEMQDEASVEAVANLVMQMNYSNKDVLVGALIIGGFDKQGGGQVYGCPIGGTLAREKWAIDGSGSTYIWGYCDAAYRLVAYFHCTQGSLLVGRQAG